MDLTKAYDSVDRSASVAVLKSYGVPHQLADDDVKSEQWTAQAFEVRPGVRQGCVLSPLLVNCFMDSTLREMTETLGGGFHIEHATGGGLILSYRDKTSTSSCVQDALYADEEGWYSVPDVEMEGISKPQSQQAHQAPCSLHVSDANPSVRCGGMACHTTRHQEAEYLPHEVPPGHPGT